MKENEGVRGSQNQERDDLDRLLDAALTKYSAVEPRKGLEERILANLEAERGRTVPHGWWRWGVVAAVAVLLIALSFALRSGKVPTPTVVRQVQPPSTSSREAETHASKRSPVPARSPHRTAHAVQTRPAVAAAPKLDVFPSPEPLSEQEQLLAQYAAMYPKRAALLAEARMESLRRDAEERSAIAAEGQQSQR